MDKVPSGLKSEHVRKMGKQNMASGYMGVPSNAVPATTSEVGKGSMEEHGVYSSYGYGYPGYNGSFLPVDDYYYFQADNSPASENGSVVYYMPGYAGASGSVVGVNGQSIGQQPYYSAPYGYLAPYGSEPYYSLNSTYLGDVPDGKIGPGRGKYVSGSTKTNGLNAGCHTGSKFYNPTYVQPTRASDKVVPAGSDMSTDLLNMYQPPGKFAYGGQKQGQFLNSNPINDRQNGRIWHANDTFRSRDRFGTSGDVDISTELKCGPRALDKSVLSDNTMKKDDIGTPVRREQYNLPDFKTVYTNAKFYVIKSYNEDDIHKSIKYSVWSSTPNGNKKLDAAFDEAEEISSEAGTKCPIFLFFSVNGSGQFVGIAEMMGKVDFDKDMSFWQIDKWMGFFPVKWHIVKDIPNRLLRHIILENNEGRAVTYSRDTQEIPHKQGLEMLMVFKNHPSKTTLFDDFDFYEDRERSRQSKKIKPATLREDDRENGEERSENFRAQESADPSSLIDLTKNLTISGCSDKINGVNKASESSITGVCP